ncbi:MAG: biotin--[acetyl-CoA-carboxylase] ligase [Rubricoccaceae bacterium]|nr:biotin--[acetyl-CoA-carboxylase] ligase [Rubricoccaceae bacterium]
MSLATDLPPLLRTERFGRALRWSAQTGSTNADAAAWADEGAPEGAVVGTDHQTAGRGRLGRAWSDTRGLNVLVSLVLRPALAADRLGLVPLAAGVAVAETVAAWTAPAEPHLKWPNDVLLGRRKVAGLLLEGSLTPGAGPTLVLGLGLNVNQTDFPAEVAERATSLALEVGRPLPRAALLADLLLALERRYDALLAGEDEALRAAFERRMVGRGQEVTVAFSGKQDAPLRGTVLGVASTGALRLATAGGLRTLSAGEVTLRADRSDA